jgi:hypothetical protein
MRIILCIFDAHDNNSWNQGRACVVKVNPLLKQDRNTVSSEESTGDQIPLNKSAQKRSLNMQSSSLFVFCCTYTWIRKYLSYQDYSSSIFQAIIHFQVQDVVNIHLCPIDKCIAPECMKFINFT